MSGPPSVRLLPAVLALLITGSAQAQLRVARPPGLLEVTIGPDLPPPPHPEAPPPRKPGRDFIWISGCWFRDGDRWVWRDGAWDRPPGIGVRWIGPVSRRDGQGYRYEPGHWSNQRVVEGEAYRKWKKSHGGDHGHR